MNTNQIHTTEVTEDELKLLEACRHDRYLASNLTELLNRYQSETNTDMDANQAEMSIVNIVRSMGKNLLTQWSEKTHEEVVTKNSLNPDFIGHGKKNFFGIAP